MKSYLLSWCSRSTVFAVFFAITSYQLSLHDLLTPTYVAMCTAIQGLVVARALGDDYHQRNGAQPLDGDGGK